MAATGNATERTRLLDGESGHLHGSVQQDDSGDQDDGHDEDDVPLAAEASTRELLAVMAAIWLGVFFAALGILPLLPCPNAGHVLNHLQIRPSSPP